MAPASLFMLLIAIVAMIAGVVVLLRPVGSEAGVYLRRMGGIMLIAFGLVLLIAAISLDSAFTEAVHA
jgi:putative Mn2+ efflux pump MntP